MADYHFVCKDVEGASTQWDDLQRKFGNLPPKPPAFKPPPFTPAPGESSIPKDKSWIIEKIEEELECNDPPPMTQYYSLLAPHIRLPRRSPILGLLSQRLA
jgi:hypothetical protein